MSSEVQARPAATRGRGSGRGGRGVFSSRGGARSANRTTGGDAKMDSLDALEDEGEIGQLKQRYGPKTALIKEMFPDWSDVDILFALQETDGDENLTVTRIAEGSIAQWGEVSSQKKDRAKSKAKENTPATTIGGSDSAATGTSRAGRGGRGAEGGRGRGRATERGGRGGGRGRSALPTTNGTHKKESQQLSVPTEESSAWDNEKLDADTTADSTTTAPAVSKTVAAPASTPSTVPTNATKTWASMLRQSTAPKPAPQPKEAPPPKPADIIEPLPPAPDTTAAKEPEPPVERPADFAKEPAPAELPTVVVPEVALPPSKHQLTEINLEQVVDESHRPATKTALSEAADSWEPRHTTVSSNATATPRSASQQQQHQAPKGPASGYAATAAKATERVTSARTPSYQRRILDQEEAVRMPGNRDVDHAAVQFGAFSLNGAEDDIDGEREEAETRAQPPADSPVAHPRASLPPVPQPASVPEAFPAQKPTVALPATTISIAPPTGPASQQTPSAAQAQPSAPGSQQYGRFGHPGTQESSAFDQKPYDSFGQQSNTSSQSQYDGLQQSQPQSQQPGGAFSSAPTDYSSYYTADQQSRAPYNYYNQHYSQQQSGQTHQDSSLSSQQRPLGYNVPQSENINQYPQSSSHQSRFGAGSAGEAQNSGNTTPNPTAQQQGSQTSQSQSHLQQQPHANQYPYGHPYYSNPYYSAYMNQYPGYGQGGYGGGPYGKSGMYGHGHQYGMSPQAPYDHNPSPAGGFGQSSLHRNDSGLASGLGDYGRAGSAQSGSQPGLGGSGFASMHDTFGRGGSYQSQPGQAFNSQSSQPGGASGANDELKPFGEGKGANGPSPALGGARPGSATNNTASQSGLPPPQSSQQSGIGSMGGYGGYPGHLQGHGGLHGSQTGASSGYGMGGGAQHANSPYGGGYGGQGFGNSYYSQQPRGWGGNYH